ncbi:MAG: hypothetical protein QNL45_07550 [Nitrospirota bacterium]|nr:hypothetical protein [Nitrospirota bacterium]
MGIWILHHVVAAIHDALIAEFGGAASVLEQSLVESALPLPLH